MFFTSHAHRRNPGHRHGHIQHNGRSGLVVGAQPAQRWCPTSCAPARWHGGNVVMVKSGKNGGTTVELQSLDFVSFELFKSNLQ